MRVEGGLLGCYTWWDGGKSVVVLCLEQGGEGRGRSVVVLFVESGGRFVVLLCVEGWREVCCGDRRGGGVGKGRSVVMWFVTRGVRSVVVLHVGVEGGLLWCCVWRGR